MPFALTVLGWNARAKHAREGGVSPAAREVPVAYVSPVSR
jgi:hypothetical protein